MRNAVSAQEIHNGADTAGALRNEPVQARSTARLTALLDAAATVVDDIGFERLTTAMVAERAGASIGTVYRYFPDRIAVLQALAARNLSRVIAGLGDAVRGETHANWSEALGAALDVLVESFRSEPSFRGLRVGDVLDLRPAPQERTFNSVVSDHLFDDLVARFAVSDDAANRLAFEIAMEVSDSLATRAFARDPQGDRAILKASRELVFGMLADRFPEIS